MILHITACINKKGSKSRREHFGAFQVIIIPKNEREIEAANAFIFL